MPISYKTGTSTDYKDLLEDLNDFITADQVITVAVNAGGSGYVVDEILTASGGTAIQAATFRVTSVSGGAVTGIEILNAGSYTSTPSNPVSTTASGSGTGCTLNLTWRAPWTLTQEIDNLGAVNATVSAGGSGYSVSDTLTLSGGTGTAATFNVDSIDGSGGVTGVSMITTGNYTVAPSNPVSTTGGGGSGCTLVVNWSGAIGELEKQFKGVGLSGTDEIYIGIRTYQDSEVDAYNWELAGFTGHDDELTFEDQPGISPGRYDSSTPIVDGGAYVPLDDGSIAYWFSVTARRIIMVTKISTSFMSMYLGYINPMATSSELPYPLLICGNTCQPATRYSSSRVSLSSIADPHGKEAVSGGATQSNGPMMLRVADGSWISFNNTIENYTTPTIGAESPKRNITPCGNTERDSVSIENTAWINQNIWEFFDIVPGGTTTTPSLEIRPTPDSGGNLVVVWPLTLVTNEPSAQIYGEIDGAFWAGVAASGLVTEDKITIGNDVYRVFSAANQTEAFQFFCIKEV